MRQTPVDAPGRDDGERAPEPPAGAPAPPPAASPPPAPPSPASPEPPFHQRVTGWLREYFLGEEPGFWVAMVPMLLLAGVLFTRHPQTNYIFDEQEALLRNPYVNAKQGLRAWDAFKRDFWGLPHDRSIGSYRPLPNLVWRAVWLVRQSPWLAHWMNVLLHAANGAMMVVFVYFLTKRKGLAWIVGAVFTASAVITEAVCGVVGIADVMGGMGAILAILALRLPMPLMPLGVMGGTLFALFSKESGMVCVPLVPIAAFLLAPLTHESRPLRVPRAVLAFVGAIVAFVVYVELRKRWFPAPMEQSLLETPTTPLGTTAELKRKFLVWYHQPPLPKDPLNNPFVKADDAHRAAGALRVYWRGIVQVVFPKTLSGDYSSPAEPVPETLWFPESILGLLGFVLPPILALVVWVRGFLRERAKTFSDGDRLALLAVLGLVWMAVSYYPHSNIPVPLPTVRAERFWYFPVIGTCLTLGAFFVWLFEKTKHVKDGSIAVAAFAFFFFFQCGAAFRHSRDYKDDLAFWDATRKAAPRSSKAHLNYSVMQGARGRMDIREESNKVALELAPEWPMAHVYLGDAICRQHRPLDAWPHYETGFVMAKDDPNLLALGIQCLWDEEVDDGEGGRMKAFRKYEAQLLEMGDKHPGSWLAYHVRDVAEHGDEHNGIDPKYRPAGYNEGVKD